MGINNKWYLINMDLLKMLPIDLVYMILNYICYPQPDALQEDIVSYVSTMKEARSNYGQHLSRLENNILYYMNNNVVLIWLQPKFRTIFSRFYDVKRSNKMNFSDKATVSRRINMLWGLLTKEERDEILCD